MLVSVGFLNAYVVVGWKIEGQEMLRCFMDFKRGRAGWRGRGKDQPWRLE